VVFYVLKTVVPLSDQQAFDCTYAIHIFGKNAVYTGSKTHCEKIANALKNIHVESEIIKE
jgi:ATP-dependent Clp protease adapter protein ClpS